MRHRKSGRKLNRNGEHRLALYRNLAKSLIQHEKIITTVAKAKAVRPFVEKLITLAKRGDLHARRLVLSRLGPAANAEVRPFGEDKENPDERTVLAKLFADIGPRFADRPGGYTRIIKRHERRLGDGGPTAFLELLKEGEKKREKAKAAPAPRVEEEEQQQPAAETPAPESQAEQPASEGGAESKPEGEAGQQPPK
jgi:large subunit ribosomal protein L17